MRRYAFAVVLALLAPSAWAQCDGFDATGWVELAHVPPLVQVDGTPIADDPVTQYRVYWGQTPGAYPNQRNFPADSESFCVDGLPSSGSVYFVGTAFNSQGEGARTNVACWTMSGPACLPGPYETDVLSVAFQDAGTVQPPPPSDPKVTVELVFWNSNLGYTSNIRGTGVTTFCLELVGGATFDDMRNVGATTPNIGGNNDSLRAAAVCVNSSVLPLTPSGDADGTLTGLRARINGTLYDIPNTSNGVGGYPRYFQRVLQ